MVWSDQSQFPFYVIDNNGNVILTIDETGLHLVGTNGRIDGIVSGGNPLLEFTDAAPGSLPSFIRLTIPPDSTGITINAPDGTGHFSMIKINQNGIFLGDINNPNIVNQVQYLNSTGVLKLSGTVNPAANWTNLVLKNGWTPAAGGWQTPQVRLNPLGAVEFRGFAQAGAIADGTGMFDLPYASLRPTTLQIMAIGVRPTGAGNNNSTCLFNNGTNSEFQIYGASGGAVATDGVILTGLSYYP